MLSTGIRSLPESMGEKYLFVDFGPLVLRYLLGDDGVHVFGLFTFENEDTPQGCLTGCLDWSLMPLLFS